MIGRESARLQTQEARQAILFRLENRDAKELKKNWEKMIKHSERKRDGKKKKKTEPTNEEKYEVKEGYVEVSEYVYMEK